MRRSTIALAFCAVAFLFFTQLTSADGLLKINLSTTKAEVSHKKIKLTLGIANASARALAANIFIEILDPKNQVLASAEKAETMNSALQTTDLDLSLEHIVGKTDREIFWYRLRYRIVADSNTTTGILALSEITSDFF